MFEISGKVFSLLASTESMTPLFASLTYTSLYEKTLSTFPGAVFYLSALLMLAMLGIYTYVYIINVLLCGDFTNYINNHYYFAEFWSKCMRPKSPLMLQIGTNQRCRHHQIDLVLILNNYAIQILIYL